MAVGLNALTATGDAPESDHRRFLPPWRATAVALAVSVPYFVRMIAIDPQGDYAGHARFARLMAEAGQLLNYSFFYPLQHLLSFGSRSLGTMQFASIVIASVFLALRVALSEWYAHDVGLSRRLSVMVALVVTVAMPVFDPLGLGTPGRITDIYLGQLPPNVWHNATSIMALPFGVAALMAAVAYLRVPSRQAAVATAAFAFASTLCKPNFTLVLVPALAIMAGVFGLRGPMFGATPVTRRTVGWLALALMPSVLALGAQYLNTFGEGSVLEARSTLEVAPLSQWSEFSDHIPLSILRSVLMPALLTVLLVRRRAVNLLVVVSWLCVAVATAQFALLTERTSDGGELFDGNWFWGVVPAMFALFLATLVAWLRDVIGPSGRWDRTLLRRSEVQLVVAVAALHTVAGVTYLLSFRAF